MRIFHEEFSKLILQIKFLITLLDVLFGKSNHFSLWNIQTNFLFGLCIQMLHLHHRMKLSIWDIKLFLAVYMKHSRKFAKNLTTEPFKSSYTKQNRQKKMLIDCKEDFSVDFHNNFL